MTLPPTAPSDDRVAGTVHAGPGWGRLAGLAAWWASCHGEVEPVDELPRRARLLLVGADGQGTGRTGTAALARVAGVGVREVEVTGDGGEGTDTTLRRGRTLVDEEVDAGADLLLVAERSPASVVPAAAAVAALTGREPVAVVGVPPGPDGRLDDEAWMRAVPAVRDLLRRARPAGRDPLAVLTHLDSPELTALTGVLAQAATRRTPVVIDGPVALAAALLASALDPDAHGWWLAGGRSPDPAAGHALDLLGLEPVVDLGLWTGRGAGALVAVGVLRAALAVGAPGR